MLAGGRLTDFITEDFGHALRLLGRHATGGETTSQLERVDGHVSVSNAPNRSRGCQGCVIPRTSAPPAAGVAAKAMSP